LIEICEVNKKLGEKQVLKDVNIKVDKGSIFGLIGPNGAGKTTLIRCLTGIYKVDKGNVQVANQEVFDNASVKKTIGYVADDNNYLSSFKVKEMIKFYELSYESFNRERFNELNKIFQIPEKRTIKKLSKGMKMRLSIMLNLSIMPEVLILDEPTSGLDPIVKKKVLSLLMEDAAERGTTILISSHNLSDLERICDSVAIMHNGEVKYCNSIEDMKRNIRKIQVVFKEEAPEDLCCWKEIINVSQVGRVYNIITKEYTEELKSKLSGENIVFAEEIDLSLEDMFIYSIEGEEGYEEIFK